MIINNLNTNHVKRKNKKRNDYLKPNTVQKMLKQLTTNLSKKNLAVTLEITNKELNCLLNKKAPIKLIYKINYALIKLYCSTIVQTDKN